MARKQNNIHYIYKTTCNVTGRWYIGMHSTSNIDDGYMGSGKILRYSIRKYGVENHTKKILEFFETREELIFREQEIITKELISDGKCMNLCVGGQGGFISLDGSKKGGIKSNKILLDKYYSDSTFKRKCDEARGGVLINLHKEGKVKYDTFSGKKHTDETKKKMSEVRKGTGTGKSNSQYRTCWVTNGTEAKKIKKEDLDLYLDKGWRKGRK
jgi:hypothetical protein